MPLTSDREHLVVSCLFGTDFDAVYPAIAGQRSVFFTDRPELRKHVGEMGWEFVLWNPDERSTDALRSSLQSKWVKFLQFLDAFDEYRAYRFVTYVDHKFFLKGEHIRWIIRHRDETKDVLVRRQNIWHRSRRKLAECGPRLLLGFRRRAYGVASADVQWSVA